MKRIALTQRVQEVNGEKRDALDQRWSAFCKACNILPILIPNHLPLIPSFLEYLDIQGFILTGGNTLHAYCGDAPERDEVEIAIVDYAIHCQLPILGVCRGMQLIQHYFKVRLEKVENHVNQPHTITWNNRLESVNSYHLYGTKTDCSELETLAKAEDGVIEAIRHPIYPIAGVMWHPERCNPFENRDLTFVKELFA